MTSIVSVQRPWEVGAPSTTTLKVTYSDGSALWIPTSARSVEYVEVLAWKRGGGVITDDTEPAPSAPSRAEIIERATIDGAVLTREQYNAAEAAIIAER